MKLVGLLVSLSIGLTISIDSRAAGCSVVLEDDALRVPDFLRDFELRLEDSLGTSGMELVVTRNPLGGARRVVATHEIHLETDHTPVILGASTHGFPKKTDVAVRTGNQIQVIRLSGRGFRTSEVVATGSIQEILELEEAPGSAYVSAHLLGEDNLVLLIATSTVQAALLLGNDGQLTPFGKPFPTGNKLGIVSRIPIGDTWAIDLIWIESVPRAEKGRISVFKQRLNQNGLERLGTDLGQFVVTEQTKLVFVSSNSAAGELPVYSRETLFLAPHGHTVNADAATREQEGWIEVGVISEVQTELPDTIEAYRSGAPAGAGLPAHW